MFIDGEAVEVVAVLLLLLYCTCLLNSNLTEQVNEVNIDGKCVICCSVETFCCFSDVGVDCPASTCGGLAMVDVARVEADFERKSKLIQTKTAVLNEKERELRLLEQNLVAREHAISWQECHVKKSAKQPAVQSSLELDSYWQHAENRDKQQTEKYRGPPNLQGLDVEHHHNEAVFDRRQHVHPPDGGVRVSSGGWAMEKLEEQFARLAQTQTNDVLPRQADIGRTQMCAEIQPRPLVVPFGAVDRHYLSTVSHPRGPTSEFSNVIRKRGRPKGSKNRCRPRMPPERAFAVGGLPVRHQLIHHVLSRGQMRHSGQVMASAAVETMRHRLVQPTTVDYRPPLRNAGMMANSYRNTVKMFASEQLVPSERPTASYETVRLSAGSPLPVLLTRGPLQSAAPPALMPSTVTQLVESAAFTTGASILPPLSPVQSTEFHTPLADDAGRVRVPQEGRNSGDHDVGKDIAYRVMDGRAFATDDAVGPPDTKPEQDVFINRSVRFPNVRQQHLSDHAASSPNNLMVTECDDGDCKAVLLQSCSRERHHILPKVSPTDSGDRWSSAQLEREEAFHRDRDISNQMSTVCDTSFDDDDSDRRLVVVIDDD